MQAPLLIQGLHVNFGSTKAAGTSPATTNISMSLQPTMTLDPTTVTTAPEYLKYIQPRPSQVCNCGKIGFDTSGSWRKVVYAYRFFTGDRIWRTQTGERAPFCFTDLIFTRYGVQCFMPPVIVHQASNYTQDLHYNIPKDWVVHNTPSGYMDRDGWMKGMMNLKTFCGSKKLNP